MIRDLFALFGLFCAAGIGLGIWELKHHKITWAMLKDAISAMKAKL